MYQNFMKSPVERQDYPIQPVKLWKFYNMISKHIKIFNILIPPSHIIFENAEAIISAGT